MLVALVIYRLEFVRLFLRQLYEGGGLLLCEKERGIVNDLALCLVALLDLRLALFVGEVLIP